MPSVGDSPEAQVAALWEAPANAQHSLLGALAATNIAGRT